MLSEEQNAYLQSETPNNIYVQKFWCLMNVTIQNPPTKQANFIKNNGCKKPLLLPTVYYAFLIRETGVYDFKYSRNSLGEETK